MNQLSGKISETPHGMATNQLDYTEILVKPMNQSQRWHNRKYKKGGWLKPSQSTRKALKSSFYRSIDGI